MSATLAPVVGARPSAHRGGRGWLLGGIVALAAWLGAALLAAVVVAPAAFAVLPTRTLAGALVGRVLPALFVAGIVVGALAATRALRGGDDAPFARRRGGAALVLALACTAAQLVVAPRIERVRSSVTGPMDALATDDPRRASFGRLHGLSVLCLGAGMVAAGAALAWSIAGLRTLAATSEAS